MTLIKKGEHKTVICPDCGGEYQRVGVHWAKGACERPDLTESQQELAKGLLMGDGTIDDEPNNCRLTVANTNLEFLNWVDDQFGVLSNGVRLHKTGEQASADALQYGFSFEDDERKYCTLFTLRFRAHPFFTKMRDQWYTDEGKRFPQSLRLTPESTRMWYVGDGSVHWTHQMYSSIVIKCENESDRPEFLKSLMEDAGFTPTYSQGLRIPTSETEEFLGWIGGPPPGFEYKYEIDSYDRYRKLRAEKTGGPGRQIASGAEDCSPTRTE